MNSERTTENLIKSVGKDYTIHVYNLKPNGMTSVTHNTCGKLFITTTSLLLDGYKCCSCGL